MMQSHKSRALGLAAATLAIAAGCTGDIGGGPAGNAATSEEAVDVAWAPIRRMTPAQYQNSVRDLLGDPDLQLDLDEDLGDAFSRLGAEKLNRAVEQVAAREALWQRPVFPCDTAGAEDLACVDSFIEDFGFLAFRRPISNEEALWLRSVYDAAKTQQSFHDALIVVLEVILQSPQFFYFPELGVASDEDLPAGVLTLSGYERATRLSFFLTGSTPDLELLEAAELGDLDTEAGVRQQAERLMGTPGARSLFRGFFAELFELDGSAKHLSLQDAQKSPAVFPEDSVALRGAMRLEVDNLVDRLVFDQKKGLRELLTTRESFVDAELAKLYGVAPPPNGAGWVTLPAERSGLLTRAAFLTLYARGDIKSPIRRGAFIVKTMLCVELGEPPPNANDVPIAGGSVDENGATVRRTIREDAQLKTMGEGCSGCHTIMNPVGFAFDNFDALGRYVTTEDGSDSSGNYSLPIDSSGALPSVGADGHMTGPPAEVSSAVALSETLAGSEGLAACMAQRWFSAATHRSALDEDQVSLSRISKGLLEDKPLYEVVLDTVVSDAFLHLRLESAQ